MKINIVNLDKDGWILTKFAKNMYRELKRKGLKVYLILLFTAFKKPLRKLPSI